MNPPRDIHRLQTTVTFDVANEFRLPHDYDYVGSLKRTASIRTRRLNPDPPMRPHESFEIELIDSGRTGPQLPQPSIIDRNVSAIFQVVQKCRDRWERALASATQTVTRADGTTCQRACYDDTWDDPVSEETFRQIAGHLAVAGERLFSGIFESSSDPNLRSLAHQLREVARSDQHAITIYAPDFHIPWRMLYTHPNRREALKDDGSNYDPTGFWGYQHVLEEFNSNGHLRDHVRANGKLSFGAALHERLDTQLKVKCLERHREFIRASEAHLTQVPWSRTVDVAAALRETPFPNQVLYFLCHAEGAGDIDSPNLRPPVLKLVDGTIDAVVLSECIKDGFRANPPLVFINACRAGHLGTLAAHNFTFATEFLRQGAVCLVAPQIEVPALFAGEFGSRFFEIFIARTAPVPRVGPVLRALTRDMWARRNPYGLAYALYADADCHVRWTSTPACASKTVQKLGAAD